MNRAWRRWAKRSGAKLTYIVERQPGFVPAEWYHRHMAVAMSNGHVTVTVPAA